MAQVDTRMRPRVQTGADSNKRGLTTVQFCTAPEVDERKGETMTDGAWTAPGYKATMLVGEAALARRAEIGDVTTYEDSIEGVVVAAGVERERRLVYASQSVASALASSGLCIVRADEWDRWQKKGGAE